MVDSVMSLIRRSYFWTWLSDLISFAFETFLWKWEKKFDSMLVNPVNG